MTYEEVKEISSRFEPFDEQCEDIRIDNTKMGDSPEIDYYEVEINVGESGKSETVVKLIIKDNGEEDDGIYVYKVEGFLDSYQKQEQQKAYDVCKQIVQDYLNGNLIKSEVKE